ncbi:MAG: SusC/RagA family TonB-linked outer membrane protein [Paludibacteraceae bacterium]|nr:SusC/RagA family TonB-linked outer membrane protein [Paludibacteraceae bacterium]
MKKFYVCLIGLCLATFAMAQTKVTGIVLEDTGEGAIGANVVAEGTSVGTVTDFDGNFELTVPAGVKRLVISYMGFKTETVAVKPEIKVTLQSESTQLEDVVVTGMVKQDKRLFTGASTKVDADKAKMDGVADISRSLEGRAAGVSVQNVSGTFGSAPKIRIRGVTSIYGSSSPLWVVDGVVQENVMELSASDLSSGDAETLVSSAISGINADDIESIQILKDGSATSIYGARAMAGVIVVTTKKAKAGQIHMNYTGEFTYRMIPSYNDYNICNSQEQMSIYQELDRKGWLEYSTLASAKNSGIYGRMYDLINSAEQGGYGIANTPEAKNAYLRQAEFANTNWFKELFNHTIMHTHSLSLTAGTERARVYASLSAMQDPGWYKASEMTRFTGNMNAAFEILPSGSKQKLTFNMASNASYRKQMAPGSISSQTDPITGAVSREFDINPFSYAMNTSRAMQPKEIYRRNYCDFNINDELDQNYMQYKITEVKFQGELNYKPIQGLEISALGAIRYESTRMEHNITDNSNQARAYRAGISPENNTIRDVNSFLYTDPDNPQALPISVLPQGGIYDLNEYSVRSIDFRGSVSYNNGFGANQEHILSIYAGAELNSTDREAIWFRGWGYQYDNGGIPYTDYRLFKQSQEENSNYYYNSPSFIRNLAFFGTASYSYAGRYTVTGTVRYEGSNMLGKSKKARWLPTWNVSAAWNAHEERWWRSTFDRWWTMAKIRASYSLTANRGPASNSLAIFEAYQPWRPLTSVTETGIQLAALENSELTYEKKRELNVGTDLSFVDGRINIIMDGYKRWMYDQIGLVQTMGVGGATQKYANNAEMEAHGIELTLSTLNIKTKDWTWTTDFTFSYNKTLITHLKSNPQIGNLVYGLDYREGYEHGSVFSIPFAGLTEEGLPTFYTDAEHTATTMTDIDLQSYTDLDFLKYEGTLDPKFTGGFRNTIGWKDLTLDIFFTYSAGNVVRLDPICYVYSSEYNDLTASMKEMKNRWMVPGDEHVTTIPTIATKRQMQEIPSLDVAYSCYNLSSERIAKGDFIRLKEISLGYSLPKKLFEGQKAVSSFSIKFSANNICLLYADKKLNGRDPEFYNTGGVSSANPRQFTLSLRLGL